LLKTKLIISRKKQLIFTGIHSDKTSSMCWVTWTVGGGWLKEWNSLPKL